MESQTLDSPMILISGTSSPTVTEKPNYCDGAKDDDDTRHASPTSSLSEFPDDCSGTELSPEDPPSSSKVVRGRAWYVMAEIMDTERAYVADLRTLHDVSLFLWLLRSVTNVVFCLDSGIPRRVHAR